MMPACELIAPVDSANTLCTGGLPPGPGSWTSATVPEAEPL